MIALPMPRPAKHPKTEVYYCRVRIPAAVHGQVFKPGNPKPLTEWRETLGTKDPAEARRLFPAAKARAEAAFREAAKRANAVAVTDVLAAEMTARWAAWIAGGAPLDIGDAAPGHASDAFDLMMLPEERTPERLAWIMARVEHHAAEAVKLADVAIVPETFPVLVAPPRLREPSRRLGPSSPRQLADCATPTPRQARISFWDPFSEGVG